VAKCGGATYVGEEDSTSKQFPLPFLEEYHQKELAVNKFMKTSMISIYLLIVSV